MRRVSKTTKRGREQAQRPAFNRVVKERAGGRCEAFERIWSVDREAGKDCRLWGSDVHEIKTRGRGGSILELSNVFFVCRPCHRWIGDHPLLAEKVGLLLPSWTR